MAPEYIGGIGVAAEENAAMEGPQIKLSEPWSQLGGSQIQLRRPQSQLGGLWSQPGGPQSQLGGPGGDRRSSPLMGLLVKKQFVFTSLKIGRLLRMRLHYITCY